MLFSIILDQTTPSKVAKLDSNSCVQDNAREQNVPLETEEEIVSTENSFHQDDLQGVTEAMELDSSSSQLFPVITSSSSIQSPNSSLKTFGKPKVKFLVQW